MDHIISGKKFANGGSDITITYDERPESITVGGTELLSYGATSVTLKFIPGKTIQLNFNEGSVTGTPSETANEVTFTVSGNKISISGAEGENKALYSASGVCVATTTGNEFTAPATGLYIVRCGDAAFKALVK